MSARPKRRPTSSARANVLSRSLTSTASAADPPPFFATSSAVSSALVTSISAATTDAPRAARASQYSRPIPRPPPVTTATRPLRFMTNAPFRLSVEVPEHREYSEHYIDGEVAGNVRSLRVLVTGASGVFGRELIGRLSRRGLTVVGFSRREPLLPKDVEFRAGDIRDADAVAAAMKGCDVVAHCAWAIGAMYGDPAEREINVGGTENVLAAMHRTGTRRIVFASSSTAYGPRPGDRRPLAEDTPLAPH